MEVPVSHVKCLVIGDRKTRKKRQGKVNESLVDEVTVRMVDDAFIRQLGLPPGQELLAFRAVSNSQETQVVDSAAQDMCIVWLAAVQRVVPKMSACLNLPEPSLAFIFLMDQCCP